MANYTAADVKTLRDQTGAGMMECKKALDEAGGDLKKAAGLVEASGLVKAEKKADRETCQGYIASYTHSNGKIGALCELRCETDYVAMNEEFRALAKDLAMQVAAYAPENESGFLEEEMIKNPDQTVELAIKSLSGKIGEKIVLGKFARLAI